MTKTTTELADAVLQDLAIADASETPDTADRTVCTNAYESIWEEMNAHGREIVYWPIDEIPRPVFFIMRDLVRLEVQGTFGMPIPLGERDVLRERILMRLYRHTEESSSGLPVESESY